MAGIIGKHVQSTNGTAASDKAQADSIALWNETQERLSTVIDTMGGDNAFKTLAAVQQFAGLVTVLENGSGLPAVIPTTIPNTPIAALTGSDGATDDEPSEAEKLGEKLLKAHAGDTTRANHSADFLIHAITGGGQELLRLLVDTVDAVTRTNSPDSVVLENGQRMLASQRSTSRRAEAFEAAFYDALSLIHGNTAAIPVASSKQLLADAKTELEKERRAAATPPAPVNQDGKYLGILEKASGINANLPATTFEQHLRVVLNACLQDGIDFAAELKRRSGIEIAPNGSIPRYIDEVIKALRPATPAPASSRELDAIGAKFSERRRLNETDVDYSNRIIIKVNEANSAKVILDADVLRAAAIFNANPGTPSQPNGTTPVGIVEAVIQHALNDTSGGARASVIQKAGGMKKVTIPATTTP